MSSTLVFVKSYCHPAEENSSPFLHCAIVSQSLFSCESEYHCCYSLLKTQVLLWFELLKALEVDGIRTYCHLLPVSVLLALSY